MLYEMTTAIAIRNPPILSIWESISRCDGTSDALPPYRSLQVLVNNLYIMEQIKFNILCGIVQLDHLFSQLRASLLKRLLISNETQSYTDGFDENACQSLLVPQNSKLEALILWTIECLICKRVTGDLGELVRTISEGKDQYTQNDAVFQTQIKDYWLYGNTTLPPPRIRGNFPDTPDPPIVIPPFAANTISMIPRDISTCPTSTPSPLIDCDELSYDQCDRFDGCFIEWGPCQTVNDGFYSPSGTLSSLPCPLQIDKTSKKYLPSSATQFCQSACIREADYQINSTACSTPPIGYMKSICSSEPIACSTQVGVIYESEGTCNGRRIGAYLRLPVSISAVGTISIETWIKVNTRMIGITVNSDMRGFDFIGIFGSFALGLVYVDEHNFQIQFSSSHDMTTSAAIEHLNEWFHIGVVVGEVGVVTFWFNGNPVGTSIIDPNITLDIASLLVPEIRTQIREFIGHVHYGPVWFRSGDVIRDAKSIFPIHYLDDKGSSSPQFELFNPRISNEDLGGSLSGFYGHVPDGYPRTRLSTEYDPPTEIPRNFRIDCRNFCYHDPSICVNECAVGLVFNPSTCLCQPLLTTTTRPTGDVGLGSTTVLASTASLVTITTTPNITASNLSWILYVILGVGVAASIMVILIRRRKTKKISAVRRGSEIHPLWTTPADGWRSQAFFNDVTFH